MVYSLYMLQLIHCSSPSPSHYICSRIFLCVATGMRSAEIPRDPQCHPGSRYQAVDNVQCPLLLKACQKRPSYLVAS